jgi:hypothetical protein
MSLKSAILSRVYAPKVRHHIPGRLRLSVPLLRRVPRGHEWLSSRLEGLFLLPGGVTEVKVSFIAGSILVHYDADHMTEESVLQWVNTLWRLIGEHYDRLAVMDVHSVDKVVEKLAPLLQAALNENHSYDKRITLPDGLWS